MPRSPAVLFAAGVAVSISLAPAASVRLAAQTPGSRGVTFNKDIAPLLWQNCATCHRPNQLAPFSLVTFNDVRPRAREIARVVTSRRMPPWKAEPGHGNFVGDRRLTDAQIAVINQWIAEGSREGDPRDLPEHPAWTPGWYLGEPDLIVTMPEPYQLAPQRGDVFRTFVIPIPSNARRYIRAMEFRPGSAKAVHHANIKIDRTRSSRQWDEREPGPGYHGGGSREAQFFPTDIFSGGRPGSHPASHRPAWRGGWSPAAISSLKCT